MSEPTPDTPPVTDLAEDLKRDPKTGRWAKGHRANETHGINTLQRRGPSPEQAAAMLAWRTKVVADLGGEHELSTIKRHLIDHLVMLGTMILFLSEHLAAVGPLTPRGRQRSCVSTFLACCASYNGRPKRLAWRKKRDGCKRQSM